LTLLLQALYDQSFIEYHGSQTHTPISKFLVKDYCKSVDNIKNRNHQELTLYDYVDLISFMSIIGKAVVVSRCYHWTGKLAI